jgi:toxin FitB
VTIILDTNVLSELRLPTPDQNVVAWFGAQAEEDLAIASFSVAEIEYGIALTPRSNATLVGQLTGWLEAILATQRILPLDAAAAQVLGRLHAVPALRNLATTPPQARRPRFGGDLVITAVAVAHNAAVATRNLDDFRLIALHCPGLTGLDPWTGRTF